MPEDFESVGHIDYLRFQTLGQRFRFTEPMKGRQIYCVFHFRPPQTSFVGQHFCGRVSQSPIAEHACDSLIGFPLYRNSLDNEQYCVFESVVKFTL